MSGEISVDTSDLLKWSRYMSNVPRRTGAAVARALNTVGDNILREWIAYNADQTGMSMDVIQQHIEVHKATPDDLRWEMDATGLSPNANWSRPWQSSGDEAFDDDRALVKIVTRGDEHVCEKCIEVSDHSPYTMAEVRAMNPTGMSSPHGRDDATNIVHAGCRCVTQAWQATRMLPVTTTADAPPELFTMRQLGRAIADELKIVLTPTN
jgi:hypothetical protein